MYEITNVDEYRIAHHAFVRYVERVEGLEFDEETMVAYIQDNWVRLNVDIRHMLSKSRYVYSKRWTKNGMNNLRLFYNFQDWIIMVQIEDSGVRRLITFLPINVGMDLPPEFRHAAIKGMMDEAIAMRGSFDEQEAEISTTIDRKIQGLMEEIKALEQQKEQALRPLEKERADFAYKIESTFVRAKETVQE
ncbi:hypothetical protein D1872_89780 [compost metagenome]